MNVILLITLIKRTLILYEPDPKIPGEIKLYKLINMALIIDAKNVFQDEMKGNISFATNFLKIYGN